MKPTLPLLVLAVIAPAALAAQSFSCHGDVVAWPSATRHGDTAGPLIIDDISAAITLARTQEAGQLCTLFTKAQSLDDGELEFYVPVGRSYDGGDWERVAGKYSGLSYGCDGGGCQVVLPEFEVNPITRERTALSYYMSAFHYELTDFQKYVRFMERASFGPDPATADSVTWGVAEMEQYIENQFGLTPTSHREYFRRRLNPRSLESYKYGRSGPHACDAESRWRSFAFTRKDKIMSQGGSMRDVWPMVPHNATLQAREVGGVTKYAWLFAGHVRTLLNAQPQWSDGTDQATGAIAPGDYKVCGADEAPGSLYGDEPSRTLYAKFRLWNDDGTGYCCCTDVYGGNPDVSIDTAYVGPSFSGDETAHVIDFTGMTVGPGETHDLREIGYDPTGGGGLGHGTDKSKSDTVLLLRAGVWAQAACSAAPDPAKADFRDMGWIYSPYYEGRRHPDWDPSMRDILDEPVYANVGGTIGRIHDRRYVPRKNTIDEPLSDGGGSYAIESVFVDINDHDADDSELTIVDEDDNPRTYSGISGNEQAVYCANDAPNVFNEAGCELSTDATACVREGADDEDTVVVTTLSETSLAAMNPRLFSGGELLSWGRPLAVRDILSSSAEWDPPCQSEAVSRWKRRTDIPDQATCDSNGQAGADTTAVFAHLFRYSVTNNDDLREVRMHNALPLSVDCDDADVAKLDLHVWADGTCYQNVHPKDGNVYMFTDSDLLDSAALSADESRWYVECSELTECTTADLDDFLDSQDYWGRLGDMLPISDLMDSLGIYKVAGGKDVTNEPTGKPSAAPTTSPSSSSVPSVTKVPSGEPSDQPSISASPSLVPSASLAPSFSGAPSRAPSTSGAPSSAPSGAPSTSGVPSAEPSFSGAPSDAPSFSGEPSSVPTGLPSSSASPSAEPSVSAAPSREPSTLPSESPSVRPSLGPTLPPDAPSGSPSLMPSELSEIARTIHDNVYEAIVNDGAIADVVLETSITQKAGGVLVCGSSGEIASEPTEDDYFDYWNWRLDSSSPESESKKTVWMKIALDAPDQLCQRTAWALSQIFQISPNLLSKPQLSEAHMNYYDGFVRNCHTTYRQVMKTVAFSVKMGMQLSHVGSTSFRTSYDRGGQARYPDENYAREAMQLETVGLDMLNMDGTKILDNLGEPVPTYDTNDILTFARAWTGFEYPIRRGNYEENDPNTQNWNDPMRLRDSDSHDWFPKKDLLDGWIGDRYPLCSDLPSRAFLKAGATYKLLGRSSSPRYQYDDSEWDGDEGIKRMTLDTGSDLYTQLCGASHPSTCSYPTVVELPTDIDCGANQWPECAVDTLRVVQVSPDVFYEYVRRPCVHFAFIDSSEAKTVFAGRSSGFSMCADPTQPVATNTCCPTSSPASNPVEISCRYHGEKVTYDTNESRCGNSGGAVCAGGTTGVNDDTKCSGQTAYNIGSPKYNHFQWTAGSCATKVKVRLDAMVALVHAPDGVTNVVRYVENSVANLNFFHVPWPKDDYVGDELFPNIDNGCGGDTCTEQDDWTCLCDVQVTTRIGFDQEPADVDTIRDTLKVGAFPPDFVTGYAAGIPILNGEVMVYHLNSNPSTYTEDSIFRLTDETDEFIDFGDEYYDEPGGIMTGYVYLKNVVSEIRIGDPSNDFYSQPGRKPLVMRNPMMFHDLVEPEIRDAHYEIDAVIHHLTSHPSTPPFVSLQLIQHFGIANPSPGYIERVATAYKYGHYQFGRYGDGTFSNLDAVVAAILLDQEAVTSTLDADPAYGGLKEPIIKVLQFMKGLSYVQTSFDRNIYPKLYQMVDKVGQMAYESPDQFSFFLPDYSPPGPFATAQIYAPPAQVLSLYTTIATVEGFFNMARHGLSGKWGGFGANNFGSSAVEAGDTSRSVGYLDFTYDTGKDATGNVQRIADLMTGGRMSTEAISEIVDAGNGMTDANKAILAQQLIATSPEFHTTNLADRTGGDRPPTPVKDRSPDDPYKAIVILNLAGGLDSFNVLMPHTTCDLYKSYRSNRGILALRDRDMLSITNDDPDQPCTNFAINNRIPIFKDIYDAGHGQFHANIGHLHKPVTKGNWITETRTHLFSHTTMNVEAQLVDAFQEDGWSTGVGGRMLDVLQRRGMSVNAIGIDGKGFIIEGNPSLGRTVDVIPSGGVNTLQRTSLESTDNDLASIEDAMSYLNKGNSLEKSGIFANYWSQNLIDILNKTDALADMLGSDDAALMNDHLFVDYHLAYQLKIVAKLMLLNERRQANRDVFYITNGGHDGHALAIDNLHGLLPAINKGITAFYTEMKDQGLLNQTTFVVISEFGRTITPNSGKGSDHAWGGNSFIWGGEVRGKSILGQYPASFDNTDITNIGRGRLIPYRSWESMWYGVANWFGITDEEDMAYVLPNNGNMGCQLYTDKDMYTVGNTTIGGCNDRTVGIKLGMLLKEPRYLTGIEQKKVCRAAISLTVKNANTTSRCVITDQKVIVYFDTNRRRVLSPGESDERILTETVVNTTLEATVSFEYDNPNGTENGTDYVENSFLFATDMNDQLANGANCAAGNGGRRLTECANALDNCEQLTEFAVQVTSAPSLLPSISSQPSSQPSGAPSSQPSQVPSKSVSPTDKQPSSEPSTSVEPSGEPTRSSQPSLIPSMFPTPPQPSSKPSVPPSSRPSRDCPFVIDECRNGGMWSPYSCECLCLSPYCPHADSTCSETNCPANYHETLFDNEPAPWFSFGPTCASTKELPSSVSAIYGSKSECCQSEFPSNSANCNRIPPAVMELTYDGKLQLIGVNCPNSGSERAAAAGNMARSILSAICNDVPGITCGETAKVSVTSFCGYSYNIEAVYSSGSRRLQTSGNDGVVAFTFSQQSLDSSTLETLVALLSSHLSGASLTSFLSDVLSDVLASNPPATLQALTSIHYTGLAAYIVALGLYYPAWGRVETCLSDGEQDGFMTKNPSSWMYETLDSCCERYYGWDTIGCKLRNAEATLVSGSISSDLDPTDSLYFPDWGITDTCINNGSAPSYMKKQHSTWMYESQVECCQAYYGWEEGFVKCMSSGDGSPPTKSPIPESWYVIWGEFICVESCEGSSPCGGLHKPWDILHSSKSECCQVHLWWRDDCMQN